jgi:alpha-tubulin suppressor-like RCC1 family protein
LNAQKGGIGNSLSKTKGNILGANGLVEGIKNDANSSSFSALYGFDVFNVTLSAVQEFPARVRIKQAKQCQFPSQICLFPFLIAVSPTHQILLTLEGRVYSWGENRFGQLGHGDRKKRVVPTQIEALEGKGVSRVAAGRHNNFHLLFNSFKFRQKLFPFLCRSGNCDGNRPSAINWDRANWRGSVRDNFNWEWNSHLKDKTQNSGRPFDVNSILIIILIFHLFREDIIDICCGDEHSAVLTVSLNIFMNDFEWFAPKESGTIFVWGRGENGRLGTGGIKDGLEIWI